MADQRVKFLVLTDWTQGAADLAALVAYSQLASGDIPVQLSYVVESEAQQSDADFVMKLIGKLPNGLDSLGGAELTVESYKEACSSMYYGALLSLSVSEQLVLDVAQFATKLAQCCAALSFKVANNADSGGLVEKLNMNSAEHLSFPGWSFGGNQTAVPAQMKPDEESATPNVKIGEDGCISFY